MNCRHTLVLCPVCPLPAVEDDDNLATQRSSGSPARLHRFPERDHRGAYPRVHLPPRHHGAGGLRHASRDPSRLRDLYRRARGGGRQGHRSGENALRARGDMECRELGAPYAGGAARRLRARESEAWPRCRARLRGASTPLSRIPVSSAHQQRGVTTMTTLRGKFIWYEVMTTDTKAAAKFYR